MKVLYINVVGASGSTGRICTDLLSCLEARGHTGAIAYGRGAAPAGLSSFRIGSDGEVRLHVLKARLLDSAGFGSKTGTRRLLRWIERERFDLIHLHNLHGYYLHVGLLFEYLRGAGLPVVWTLHDCWPMTGHCTHFEFARCDKWRTGCFACPEKGRYPASLLLDNARSNYARKKALFTGVPGLTLVSPSQWLAGLARQSFLKDCPVTVIANGIDRQTFRPTPGDARRRLGLEGAMVLLAAAGRWYDRKGLDDLGALAGKLRGDERLVVVGLTAQQRRALPEGVVALGRAGSASELAALYTMADVFINPTKEDNLPTVNLEALACGTPVVTYDTGGSPETLPAGGGAVAAQRTPEALLKAARALGRKAPGAASFDVPSREDAAERYLALYQEILGRALA